MRKRLLVLLGAAEMGAGLDERRNMCMSLIRGRPGRNRNSRMRRQYMKASKVRRANRSVCSAAAVLISFVAAIGPVQAQTREPVIHAHASTSLSLSLESTASVRGAIEINSWAP